MTEKTFQSTMIRAIRAQGLYADNMEVASCPGWPDIFITDGSRFALVELKSGNYGPNRRIRTMLSKAQLPWWMNYLSTTDANNLVLCVRTGRTEIRTIFVTHDKCTDIKNGATLSDIPGIDTRNVAETATMLKGILFYAPTP